MRRPKPSAAAPGSTISKSIAGRSRPVYGESRTVQEGTVHLKGTSSWGQFLDYREGVNPALQAQFLAQFTQLNIHRLWEAFPLPTYNTLAPIQAFYDLYQVDAGSPS